MARYTRHLDTMTIEMRSPFFERRYHRMFRITPREYLLLLFIGRGWQGTQRELAALTGYTIGGLAKALKALRSGGLIAMTTRLGRSGWSRFWRQTKARFENVRERSEVLDRPTREGDEAPLRTRTFTSIEPVADGMKAWRDLRETLFAKPRRSADGSLTSRPTSA